MAGNIVINKYVLRFDIGCFTVYNNELYYIVDWYEDAEESVALILYKDKYMSHNGNNNNVRGYEYCRMFGNNLYYIDWGDQQELTTSETNAINECFSLLLKYDNMPNIMDISFASLDKNLKEILPRLEPSDASSYSYISRILGKFL